MPYVCVQVFACALLYIYCADCWSCRPPELHLSVKPQMIKVNVVLEWIESTASEFHRRAVCVFYLYVTSWMLISSYVVSSLQIFRYLIWSCLVMLNNPVSVFCEKQEAKQSPSSDLCRACWPDRSACRKRRKAKEAPRQHQTCSAVYVFVRTRASIPANTC